MIDGALHSSARKLQVLLQEIVPYLSFGPTTTKIAIDTAFHPGVKSALIFVRLPRSCVTPKVSVTRLKPRRPLPHYCRCDFQTCLDFQTDFPRVGKEAEAATFSGPASLVQSNSKKEQIEAEIVTLKPSGFDPVVLTPRQGRFLLAVDNQSGVHDLVLRLERERGDRLHEVHKARGDLAWRKLVDLPAGNYLLREANHADWICHITITDNRR